MHHNELSPSASQAIRLSSRSSLCWFSWLGSSGCFDCCFQRRRIPLESLTTSTIGRRTSAGVFEAAEPVHRGSSWRTTVCHQTQLVWNININAQSHIYLSTICCLETAALWTGQEQQSLQSCPALAQGSPTGLQLFCPQIFHYEDQQPAIQCAELVWHSWFPKNLQGR